MPELRRRFSPQLKAEAVQMVIETGRPIAEVARDLGVNDGTLGNWVKCLAAGEPRARRAADPDGACACEGAGGGEPSAADGKRVPEKSRGLLRPAASLAERCALIEAEKASYPISWMCGQLGVARSSFYAWRNRTETPTAARRRELAEHVKRVFDSSRRVFGCRRVAAGLNRDGAECSVGLVADLMRELGLKGGAAARLQAHDAARRATGRLAGPDRA